MEFFKNKNAVKKALANHEYERVLAWLKYSIDQIDAYLESSYGDLCREILDCAYASLYVIKKGSQSEPPKMMVSIWEEYDYFGFRDFEKFKNVNGSSSSHPESILNLNLRKMKDLENSGEITAVVELQIQKLKNDECRGESLLKDITLDVLTEELKLFKENSMDNYKFDKRVWVLLQRKGVYCE